MLRLARSAWSRPTASPSRTHTSVQGGVGQITDEHGELSLGAGKRQTLTVGVRRIGFQPWFGKLEFPDTGSVLTVVLPGIAQELSAVHVAGSAPAPSAALKGFYDRWMMRQKGTLSAVFIGPEEIEFRHPDKITNMLSGLNGVMLKRGARGSLEAYNPTGTCRMAILLDGTRQCPKLGCDVGPPPGVWYHCAVDGESQTISLFRRSSKRSVSRRGVLNARREILRPPSRVPATASENQTLRNRTTCRGV